MVEVDPSSRQQQASFHCLKQPTRPTRRYHFLPLQTFYINPVTHGHEVVAAVSPQQGREGPLSAVLWWATTTTAAAAVSSSRLSPYTSVLLSLVLCVATRPPLFYSSCTNECVSRFPLQSCVAASERQMATTCERMPDSSTGKVL